MLASWTDDFDFRSVSSLYTYHCFPDMCFAGVSSPVYEFCGAFVWSHVLDLCVQAIREFVSEVAVLCLWPVPVMGPHHCAEMSVALVISESGGPISGWWSLFCVFQVPGVGLSVSTTQVVLARPLQRFSIFRHRDLGWEHGSPFSGTNILSVSMAVFLGACAVYTLAAVRGAVSLI